MQKVIIFLSIIISSIALYFGIYKMLNYYTLPNEAEITVDNKTLIKINELNNKITKEKKELEDLEKNTDSKKKELESWKEKVEEIEKNL